MSKMNELAYDIEQMYIEGYSPKTIATQLGCRLEDVYGWLESNSVTADEDVAETPQEEIYSPYFGA